jgi:putative ABC transport system ATP-binding protein
VYVLVTPPENDVLWAHGVVRSHQGTPALRGISIGVRLGEVLAVIGPHGSGKSTLLQCLGGVLPVDEGEIHFQGSPVHTLSPRAREQLRREHFGFVGSRPALVPELTALENAALPLMLGGAPRREALAVAAEWLERLDVPECARSRPAALRQEQRQRIAVARALAHQPAVVLADEPTAPLQREAGEQVLRVLATAARSHGISLLITGTDTGIARYADRVAAISDGRLSTPVPARDVPLPVDASTWARVPGAGVPGAGASGTGAAEAGASGAGVPGAGTAERESVTLSSGAVGEGSRSGAEGAEARPPAAASAGATAGAAGPSGPAVPGSPGGTGDPGGSGGPGGGGGPGGSGGAAGAVGPDGVGSPKGPGGSRVQSPPGQVAAAAAAAPSQAPGSGAGGAKPSAPAQIVGPSAPPAEPVSAGAVPASAAAGAKGGRARADAVAGATAIRGGRGGKGAALPVVDE